MQIRISYLIRFLLPFTYFVQSRLTRLKDWVFHGIYEWLISYLLLIIFFQGDYLKAFFSFLLAYIAFISIYEIGYIFNDFVSTRKEVNPRKRISHYEPTALHVSILVLSRLLIFGIITTLFVEKKMLLGWGILYLSLGLIFTLHNLIKNNALKLITFINLAYFRFIAPIFLFIPNEIFTHLSCAVLLCYVAFRFLTYAESKSLMTIPNRQTSFFKINFYILLLPLSLMLFLQDQVIYALLINGYYLGFYLLEWGVKKVFSLDFLA